MSRRIFSWETARCIAAFASGAAAGTAVHLQIGPPRPKPQGLNQGADATRALRPPLAGQKTERAAACPANTAGQGPFDGIAEMYEAAEAILNSQGTPNLCVPKGSQQLDLTPEERQTILRAMAYECGMPADLAAKLRRQLSEGKGALCLAAMMNMRGW